MFWNYCIILFFVFEHRFDNTQKVQRIEKDTLLDSNTPFWSYFFYYFANLSSIAGYC